MVGREGIWQRRRPEATMAQNGLDDLCSSPIFLGYLPAALAGIWSEDRIQQLKITNFLRRVLMMDNPPINAVVDLGVVPPMVKFLTSSDRQLQVEAVWVLTYISSGTSNNTKAVVESGAIPVLIKLLTTAIKDVREMAVWTLGNVAAQSPRYRDLVLNQNALMSVLCQFLERKSPKALRIAAWTVANFFRGEPHPPFEQIKPAIPVLKRLLQSTDEEVLIDACSALSCVDERQAVIDACVIPRLIELLSHSSLSVLLHALRTIGNIVTGDDEQTQTVLDHQVLPCLMNLLRIGYVKSIKKEACWIISNITAWKSNQIQAVIEAGIIPSLVLLLQTAELDVKREAAYGISNAISSGTHEQIKFMVSQGCIKPICDLLTCPDPRIVVVCLDALENILVVGEAEKNTGEGNLYATMINKAGGLEKIENLQSHDNNEIYQKALEILETFWGQDVVNVTPG